MTELEALRTEIDELRCDYEILAAVVAEYLLRQEQARSETGVLDALPPSE